MAVVVTVYAVVDFVVVIVVVVVVVVVTDVWWMYGAGSDDTIGICAYVRLWLRGKIVVFVLLV